MIAQIHPRERDTLDALPLRTLRPVDERRYGSTLLLFYQRGVDEGDEAGDADETNWTNRARQAMSANRTSKFAFLDEGEAIRLLGVDRDALLTFVREKRLRSYPGVGKGHFFRVSDLEKLAAELNPVAAPEPETASPGSTRGRALPMMQSSGATQGATQAVTQA